MIDLDRMAPGVYRLARADKPNDAREAASGSGWRFVELRGEEIDSKAAFLSACGQAFGFPRWFGANWDALSDSLCDLSWLEPAPRMLVLFDNADGFGRADAESFATAIEILVAACAWWETRGMRVVVLVRGAPRGVPLRKPPPLG